MYRLPPSLLTVWVACSLPTHAHFLIDCICADHQDSRQAQHLQREFPLPIPFCLSFPFPFFQIQDTRFQLAWLGVAHRHPGGRDRVGFLY